MTNLLQKNFATISRVNEKLQLVFQNDAINLEKEVTRLTDFNFSQTDKIEQYKNDLHNQQKKMDLSAKGHEIRGAILNGAVPFSQRIIKELSVKKALPPENIYEHLKNIFGDVAFEIIFWDMNKTLQKIPGIKKYSVDFFNFVRESAAKGKIDWFEDELGARDIIVSLTPYKANEKLQAVFIFVFDISSAYSYFENAERLGLSIESSKIQEERLKAKKWHMEQLQAHRIKQKKQIAHNTEKSKLIIQSSRNQLIVLIGVNMAALIFISVFLFWWFGSRRITNLKNWLAETTKDVYQFQNGNSENYIRNSILKKRIGVQSKDEIGALSNGINYLLESLDKTTVSKNLLGQEIEERKKIERKLRENQHRLKTIFNSVQAGVVIINALTHKIVDINPAAVKMIKGQKDQIIGKKCHEFICPDKEGRCTITDLGQTVINLEKTLLTADGSYIPVIKTETEIFLDENKYLIGTFVDISDIKEVKRGLEHAMEVAERANQVKGEFLANMSHEIRTPLNGVIGMTELALDTATNEEQKHIFKTINNEATSLIRIINDILDFSKIEAGKLDLEYIPFNIVSLVEEVAKSISIRVRHDGLKVLSFISPDIPTYMIGDSGRLRQILINLGGNAVKFTSKGEISFKVEKIKEEGEKIHLKFLVSDTGAGIPKKKLNTIFESFTQADSSTTRIHGGTGLGTTIAKQLVELMNGKIEVESKEGIGSAFWFNIFLNKAGDREEEKEISLKRIDHSASLPEPKEPDEKSLSRTYRILLAEDYPANQEITLRFLVNAGYHVELAENGRQAVQSFNENFFNIILMDIQMPVMDGFEATTKIRMREKGKIPARRTPIIAMTAHALRSYKEKCLEADMDDYISKPFNRSELLKIISKWLPGNDNEIPVKNNVLKTIGKNEEKDPHINIEKLLKIFNGNHDSTYNLINSFLENAETQQEIIKKAIDNKDYETIWKESHTIKGGAYNLTAVPLGDIALEIEKSGRSRDILHSKKMLTDLIIELENIKAYVNSGPDQII